MPQHSDIKIKALWTKTRVPNLHSLRNTKLNQGGSGAVIKKNKNKKKTTKFTK